MLIVNDCQCFISRFLLHRFLCPNLSRCCIEAMIEGVLMRSGDYVALHCFLSGLVLKEHRSSEDHVKTNF